MRDKDGFILDLDGVVYEGTDVLPGVLSTIALLQRHGKRVAYLTNNSARGTQDVFDKLVGMGVPCKREEVLASSEAAALFMAEQRIDRGRGVFVIGTGDLEREVRRAGLALGDVQSCGAMLVGYTRDFSYAMLSAGLDALSRGVPLVACNRDASFPGQGGKLLPGCGPIVAALEAASERRADYVVGKPQTLMLDLLLARLKLSRAQCVMVGDVLDSDIRMAVDAKMASVWISRGRTLPVRGDLPIPDAIAGDLRELGLRLFP